LLAVARPHPGHQSLELRLGSGEIVLAADARYFCQTLRERRLPRYAPDRGSSIWAIRWCGWPGEIDWGFLDRRFASVCTPGPGQPGLPGRDKRINRDQKRARASGLGSFLLTHRLS
jgi:hypothetical protein